MMRPSYPPSPIWSLRLKRIVVACLIVVLLLLVYQLRQVIVPLIMALVVAYVVSPIVGFIDKRTKLSRTASIAVVYLFIVVLLVAIPATTVPVAIREVGDFVENLPRYLAELNQTLSQPIIIAGFQFELDVFEQLSAEISSNLLNIFQSLGQQFVTILGSVAGATLSTLGWILVVLVLSFYMVKDYELLFGTLVRFIPESHQGDAYQLGREISRSWNAFLRGQLLLCLIIGVVTFVVALVIGLPNPLLLATFAGIAEIIPNLGPAIASVPAVFVALFQNEASWIGQQLSPFVFALIVLGVYILIQQVENIWLVPRIIGESLNLHPFVVFLGAIVGGVVAGILGVLLASPVLASIRLLIIYLFRKLSDVPPFPLTGAPIPSLPELDDQLEEIVEELMDTQHSIEDSSVQKSDSPQNEKPPTQ